MRRSNRVLVALLSAVMLLSAAAGGLCFDIPLTGGKTKKIAALELELSRLQQEISAKQQALDASNSEVVRLTGQVDDLAKQNAQLEGELSTVQGDLSRLQGQFGDVTGQMEACQEKLATETKRGSGIKVIFFNGDIIYEIASDAFVDYRAGLRYRSLGDEAFFEKLQSFERGQGGDFDVLAVLKEVDKSRDRLIDEDEALKFRKIEETRFSQIEASRDDGSTM